MTVRELIAALSTQDQDASVVVCDGDNLVLLDADTLCPQNDSGTLWIDLTAGGTLLEPMEHGTAS